MTPTAKAESNDGAVWQPSTTFSFGTDGQGRPGLSTAKSTIQLAPAPLSATFNYALCTISALSLHCP